MIIVNLNSANFNNSYFHKRSKENCNKILKMNRGKVQLKGFLLERSNRSLSSTSSTPFTPKRAEVKIQQKLHF